MQPGGPLTGHGLPRDAAQSTNWPGYAATGKFTSVSANWTEPTGHCTSASRYSSFWAGLDGFNSNTVEQANGSAIGNSGPVQINMVESSGQLKDQTSALSGGTSFSDTWLRATWPSTTWPARRVRHRFR